MQKVAVAFRINFPLESIELGLIAPREDGGSQ